MDQARRIAGRRSRGGSPENFRLWLVTMEAENFSNFSAACCRGGQTKQQAETINEQEHYDSTMQRRWRLQAAS